MNIKYITGALTALLMASSVQAGIITQEFTQVADGEDFTFNFEVDELALDATSSLEITVLGDFSFNQTTNEFFTVSGEGIVPELINQNTADSFISTDYNTTELFISYFFDAQSTENALLDNQFNFTVNLSDDVSVGISNFSSFVRATFTYVDGAATDIPEPSTIAIFTLGLFGLASRKFKNKA